ncbi:MAG: hypothetical protein RR500_04875 [Bacilli bacterium]
MIDLTVYTENMQNIIKGTKAEDLPTISKIVSDTQADYEEELKKKKAIEDENKILKDSLEKMRQQTMDLLFRTETKQPTKSEDKKDDKKSKNLLAEVIADLSKK